MFGFGPVAENADTARFWMGKLKVLAPAALLLSTPVFRVFRTWLASTSPLWSAAYASAEGLFLLALFEVGVSCLAMDAHNPFIYFNF